jgi:hypothetical protein
MSHTVCSLDITTFLINDLYSDAQKNVRGGALVEEHSSKDNEEEDPKAHLLWDHSRDMSMGGRLMDDGARKKLLNDAKGLGDRFGAGSSGSFL